MSASQRLFNRFRVGMIWASGPRGLHHGLIYSSASGWLADHAGGGLAATRRGKRRERWRPWKGRIEEPRVQTLGRIEFRSRSNPEGVEQQSCGELVRSTFRTLNHSCLPLSLDPFTTLTLELAVEAR